MVAYARKWVRETSYAQSSINELPSPHLANMPRISGMRSKIKGLFNTRSSSSSIPQWPVDASENADFLERHNDETGNDSNLPVYRQVSEEERIWKDLSPQEEENERYEDLDLQSRLRIRDLLDSKPLSPIDNPTNNELCQRCLGLTLVHMDYLEWSDELLNIRSPSWPLYLTSHGNILELGALNNCRLCTLIRQFSPESFFNASSTKTELTLIREKRSFFGTDPIFDIVSPHITRDDKTPIFSYTVQAINFETGDLVSYARKGSTLSQQSGMNFAIFKAETVAAKLLGKRSPPPGLGPDMVFHQIHEWMQDCAQNHPACSRATDQVLPTRVLNVGSLDQEPFVVQPAPGTIGQYATLSYCWGTTPQAVLTEALIKSNELVFKFTSLPPTIQDAITVCRQLKIPYLWVDALCIIQDSLNGDDWSSQSAVMDDIYGNAVITLAAAAGSDVYKGLFHHPPSENLHTCDLPLDIRTVENGSQNIEHGIVSLRFYPYDIDNRQPLASRAWAFQECAMSYRILSFHQDQLGWECKTKKCYIDGPLKVPHKQTSRSWKESVTAYTKCSLTFENDRLMALSGFARSKDKEYQTRGIDNQYLAGLWRKNLVDHLLWVSTVKPPPVRPKNYRAPTWSWASINGPVEYVPDERKGEHSQFELQAVSITTNPLNPFGTLLASPQSFIQIKGFLKPLSGLSIPSASKPMPTQSAFRKENRSWWIEFDILDVEERMEKALAEVETVDKGLFKKDEVHCLRLTDFTALILILVGRENGFPCFERVGIIRFWVRDTWDWWDDVMVSKEIYLV